MLPSKPSHLTTSPHRPFRLARWCSKATVVIGRESKPGWIEVLLGSYLVEQARPAKEHVPCCLLEGMSDEEVARLAELEGAGVGDRLDRRLEALDVLVRSGLPLETAGAAIGLKNRHDAWRLRAMRRLAPVVLQTLSDRGLSENHGRWLLDVPIVDALESLKDPPLRKGARPKKVSVATLKEASRRRVLAAVERDGMAPPGNVTAAPSPATALATATASEEERIGAWLNTTVHLDWDGARGTLRVAFFDAASLAGVFEKLRRGHGDEPPPPDPVMQRWLTIPIEGLDELAYLTGTAND